MTRDDYRYELENRISSVNTSFYSVKCAASCSCNDDDLEKAISDAELNIENIEAELEELKDYVEKLKELEDVEIEEDDEDAY